MGVAIFPMTLEDPKNDDIIFQGIELFKIGNFSASLHGLCAVALFLCMTFVCVKCASETLNLIKENNKKRYNFYKSLYNILGTSMILFPIVAWLLCTLFNIHDKTVLFVEAAGIFAFAIFWWIKSNEISETNAEKKLLGWGAKSHN